MHLAMQKRGVASFLGQMGFRYHQHPTRQGVKLMCSRHEVAAKQALSGINALLLWSLVGLTQVLWAVVVLVEGTQDISLGAICKSSLREVKQPSTHIMLTTLDNCLSLANPHIQNCASCSFL